ncbi:hypothetical protein K491DRAFT_597871 [Lophiostoma macrostomum CBS 122681]|uniref:C2H2-type domain-containing protein n=1 Tax=Lophiostoma macrostomum CBS 122681 TaxID=1314788 RepID=A0A6A6TBF3_9PLEO|nr:hypothetical protein K491DRAFT_597871 [Lophiostoma macrostomum CBS 122681]
MSTSTLTSESWEKAHYLSLTLWDIDREFQKSHEAYEQWLSASRRKRAAWDYFGTKRLDVELGKALRSSHQVQELLEKGIESFGSSFEQGDSICHSTLLGQLLRIQHEIRAPLEDAVNSRTEIATPTSELLTAAKGVRRTCLLALRDQHARLKDRKSAPFLPAPQFSVNYCPFAAQLQKDRKNSSFSTKKARPHDRYDERELCPYCAAHISVTMHSGLSDYRRLLFQAHLVPSSQSSNPSATFACTSCYKTFEDSYSFLDHVYQKEVGSERSCQRRLSISWQFNQSFLASDPALVEKCLRNCLRREMTRARTLQKTKDLEASYRGSVLTTITTKSVGL